MIVLNKFFSNEEMKELSEKILLLGTLPAHSGNSGDSSNQVPHFAIDLDSV